MVPARGLEPRTYRLRGGYSAIELYGHGGREMLPASDPLVCVARTFQVINLILCYERSYVHLSYTTVAED